MCVQHASFLSAVSRSINFESDFPRLLSLVLNIESQSVFFEAPKELLQVIRSSFFARVPRIINSQNSGAPFSSVLDSRGWPPLASTHCLIFVMIGRDSCCADMCLQFCLSFWITYTYNYRMNVVCPSPKHRVIRNLNN